MIFDSVNFLHTWFAWAILAIGAGMMFSLDRLDERDYSKKTRSWIRWFKSKQVLVTTAVPFGLTWLSYRDWRWLLAACWNYYDGLGDGIIKDPIHYSPKSFF